MRDFQEDSKIDKFHLDVAAENQATIYSYWANEAALSRTQEEAADITLRVVRADAGRDARATMLKPTEAAVAEAVTKAESVQEAERKRIEAGHARALAEAAVRTMDHRKSMIEVLARLWVAGYYGDPNTKNRGDEQAQRSRAALNESMRHDG